MHHYRIVNIKNQLRHLQLGYLGIEINLSNAIDICLPIFKANYIRNK